MYKKISFIILFALSILLVSPVLAMEQLEVKNVTVEDNNDPVLIYDFGTQNYVVTGVYRKLSSESTYHGSMTSNMFTPSFPYDLVTGKFFLLGGSNIGGGGSVDFLIVGDKITVGALAEAGVTLTTIMGVVITSSVDLATTVFTTYWPYMLVIGIIAGLIVIFARLTGLGIGNRKY